MLLLGQDLGLLPRWAAVCLPPGRICLCVWCQQKAQRETRRFVPQPLRPVFGCYHSGLPDPQRAAASPSLTEKPNVRARRRRERLSWDTWQAEKHVASAREGIGQERRVCCGMFPGREKLRINMEKVSGRGFGWRPWKRRELGCCNEGTGTSQQAGGREEGERKAKQRKLWKIFSKTALESNLKPQAD